MVSETRRAQWHRPHSHLDPRGRITRLLLWQVLALAGQVAAVALARQGVRTVAEIVSDISLVIAYSSALWVLTAAHLQRSARNAAVLCLGLTPTLMWRATNPMLFTGFDEQLHMRTLGDIISSHRLFEANPLLEVSSRYPGIEALATLVHQCGIPTMAAAFLVVIACRVVLVTVLCDAVEYLTGSDRAGGLAVAVYAFSSQFVFFNSQFAYQTMALPLALAAVSLTARAREAAAPLPYLGGAAVCLLAVAVTHHVTGFATAGLMVVWAVLETGRARLWIACGAVVAVATTLTWALFQRELLSGYLGPIVDDVRTQFAGGERRELFKDSAGVASRSLDQYLLLYYAGALCVIALTVVVLAARQHHLRAGPLLLLTMFAASIPVLLAARVVPSGGELYDRSNSFLFLPFGLTVAGFAAWHWWREEHHPGFREGRRVAAVRIVGIALASATFLGGYALGAGPNWARLPGTYMAAADTRSMDAETLAAVRWAREALPAGGRIAADRVSSVLLASQAGMWPVMKGPNGFHAPDLYVADSWGPEQTDIAGAMRLRYLYVDRRLADELPHFGSYFFAGEAGQGRQLTVGQLTKFDEVPGISLVYRHGPVSIYDIAGLGIPELRSGWFGTTPQVRPTTQIAVGLVCGLLIAVMMRTGAWPRIRDSARRLRGAWGPALTGAVLLAGTCLVSVALLLAGVWLTPLTLLSGAGAVVLARFPGFLAGVRRGAARVTRPAAWSAVQVGVPFAAVVAAAFAVAVPENVTAVRAILEDPQAVRVPAQGPDR